MSLAENSLGQQLQEHRIRRGLSQTAVAQQIGVTPSTINRFETGARAPGREALLAIGRALEIDRTELDHLLRAAGELPLDLIEVGIDDPDLRLCLSILADPAIPAAEKDDFRWQIRLAARRWRAAAPAAGNPPPEPMGRTPAWPAAPDRTESPPESPDDARGPRTAPGRTNSPPGSADGMSEWPATAGRTSSSPEPPDNVRGRPAAAAQSAPPPAPGDRAVGWPVGPGQTAPLPEPAGNARGLATHPRAGLPRAVAGRGQGGAPAEFQPPSAGAGRAAEPAAQPDAEASA